MGGGGTIVVMRWSRSRDKIQKNSAELSQHMHNCYDFVCACNFCMVGVNTCCLVNAST